VNEWNLLLVKVRTNKKIETGFCGNLVGLCIMTKTKIMFLY